MEYLADQEEDCFDDTLGFSDRDEYDPDVIPATPDALRQRLSAYIVPRPTELPLLPSAGTILSTLIPIEVIL